MKNHLENYNQNDLKDFYTNVHSTEDVVLCITASLYADKNDVIE
jgi:iron uptake system EfeUOB component EfeO/EfeM